MKGVCIYHANCVDGFTAAWAVWKRYGDDLDYFAAAHGQEGEHTVPSVEGQDVIIVDFSYPRAKLKGMAEAARSLTVFDHHASAKQDLEGFPERVGETPCRIVFDMDRSGAGITWDELHGGPRPWVVDYAEDRDLWRFKLPDSRELNGVLSTAVKDFEVWEDLASDQDLADGPGSYPGWAVDVGKGVIRKVDAYVRAMVEHAYPVELPGVGKVACVNAPYVDCSELGDALAKADSKGVSVTWFVRGDGKVQYGLRSRKGIDVAKVATKLGGGGHKDASGFILDSPASWSFSTRAEKEIGTQLS